MRQKTSDCVGFVCAKMHGLKWGMFTTPGCACEHGGVRLLGALFLVLNA